MNKITVVMGEYPQNCGLEKEPIEWIVLKEEKNRCLCISKYLVDTKPYHNLSENVTWSLVFHNELSMIDYSFHKIL